MVKYSKLDVQPYTQYQDRIVEIGKTKEVIVNPQNDYIKFLIRSALTLDTTAKLK